MEVDLSKVNEIAETVLNVLWPIVLILIPVVSGLIMKSLKTKESREIFNSSIDTAYLVVSQIARKTLTPLDDKVAEALKIMSESLGRELTEKEKAEATLKLKAKHEVTKFPNLLNIKEVGSFVGKLLNKDK